MGALDHFEVRYDGFRNRLMVNLPRVLFDRMRRAFGGGDPAIDTHRVGGRPRVLSLTQATELATVYSIQQLQALQEAARTDRIIKGLIRGDAWAAMARIVSRIAGASYQADRDISSLISADESGQSTQSCLTAMIRSGPPLPPAIFIGKAITSNPRSGSRFRSARFSNTGTL